MFEEQDSEAVRIARRGFLTGVVGVAGVGVLAGRVRASHNLGTLSDESVDAGDLSRGQTATVQSVTLTVESGKTDNTVEKLETNISGVTAADIDSIAWSHGGTQLGSATVTSSLVTLTASTPVTVAVGTSETFDVSVTLANDASAGTLTLDTSLFAATGAGTYPTSSVKDTAPESIVVPEPKPVAYRRPHFSLVADRRSWLEGVDGAERVTITPENPRVGETVTLTATVTNVGTRGGRYIGRLTNYFEILGREEVYLDVGETATLTYEFTLEKAGTHRLFLTDDHVGDVVVSR